MQAIIKESSKIDLFTTIKSKESQVIQFNNLKQTNISAKFQYNFYHPRERELDTQEDRANDPFLKRKIFDVPRYVKLTWTPQNVTEPISGIEPDFTLTSFLQNKNIVPDSLFAEGRRMQIVDIHYLEKLAFNSLSNETFANTVDVLLSTPPGSALAPLSSLPIVQPLRAALASFLTGFNEESSRPISTNTNTEENSR